MASPTNISFHIATHQGEWLSVPQQSVGGQTRRSRAMSLLSAPTEVAGRLALAELIYARPKYIEDLQRLFTVQAGRLDLEYLRRWLPLIVPAGDTRLGLFEDLAKREPS